MIKIKEITSLNNSNLKEVVKLKTKKYRNLWNKFIIEGFKEIELAVNSNLVLTIITTKAKFDIYKKFATNLILVTDRILAKISQHKNPSEAIAVCKFKKQPKIDYFLDSKRLIIIENIQDPGNFGTIIRNSYSFGFDIVYSGVDLYNFKTISASKGAIFKINIYFFKNILDFFAYKPKQEILITSLDRDSQNISNFKIIPQKPYAIIFGNESKGISKKLYKISDKKIYIPINFESLNVACAQAIFCHLFQLKK
ncbi:TrmH family RNA methyltransferase [Mesomycoplasma flocculare]|uniref:rRNA methyltransferase n=1 Tax=Mesomycoplasma flocculare ATCC 27399 TaxID=743971 RepID=A0A0A8E7I5_MESFC|nr:RNA methyltransferase [Mesomycoplasma flocculare]AJC49949.1 rRNA methyltransferase [Mesomycoplasma flocculare ATCC 27399]